MTAHKLCGFDVGEADTLAAASGLAVLAKGWNLYRPSDR